MQHLDILNYTNKVFRHLYSKAYIDLVNKMPEVPGWFYDKLDKPWKNERTFRLNDGPLMEYSCEENNRSLWEGRITNWSPPWMKKR